LLAESLRQPLTDQARGEPLSPAMIRPAEIEVAQQASKSELGKVDWRI
jgi:hypothetical protein